VVNENKCLPAPEGLTSNYHINTCGYQKHLDVNPAGHRRQLKHSFVQEGIEEVSPPFEGGVAAKQ
jgi:hypothetical protein